MQFLMQCHNPISRINYNFPLIFRSEECCCFSVSQLFRFLVDRRHIVSSLPGLSSSSGISISVKSRPELEYGNGMFFHCLHAIYFKYILHMASKRKPSRPEPRCVAHELGKKKNQTEECARVRAAPRGALCFGGALGRVL